MQWLQSLPQNDPNVLNLMRMAQGKTPAQIMETAQNLAQSRGVDFAALRQQLNIYGGN